MKTDALTPPERCPVCGAGIKQTFSDRKGPWRWIYGCDASWHEMSKWVMPCRYAFKAALRCSATLEPTPLEAARQALVDAAVIWRGPDETLKIENDLVDAVDAYLALLEPKP